MNLNSVVPADVRDTLQHVSPTSLYVHVPFCASRCFYCDFTTYVAPSSAVESYVDALQIEFDLLSNRVSEPLQTVFFGGGTPTLLSSRQLERVLTSMRNRFPIGDDAEITFEANPGTVDAEKLEVMRAFGVNRISFGAQSLNERLLMAIGRLHDAEAVYKGVELAHAAGYPHINVDLMFGLPEQGLHDVEASLDGLMAMDVDHVSAYWLKVEPGTPFAKWQSQGELPLPGEDAEADMYDLVRERLAAHGYVHYEVSNFAKPGGEARHNLVYWRNEGYWAAGVGAHGYAYGVRYENVKSLLAYHDKLSQRQRPIAEEVHISTLESMEDTMMLGLRLRGGVPASVFAARHGFQMHRVFGDIIERLSQQGLVEWSGDSLRLTDKAWPIANVVFEEFIGTQA
jgi:oxygen-independent coproporphyrinogen III oxidase